MKYLILSLVFLTTLALAAPAAHARGGGGCVAEGTLIDVPSTDGPARVPVESLRPGDQVISHFGGNAGASRVIAVQRVEPDEFVELTTPHGTLRLTREHPVAVAPGVFRIAGDLRPGDALISRRLLHVNTVVARQPAYHLVVNPGGTFTANGALVHNKGCFLPDTPVLLPDGQWRAISALRVGDRVMAFDARGRPLTTTVREVFSLPAPDYLEVTTDRHVVHATREHPFFVGDGEFRTLEALRVGDRIYAWDGRTLTPQPIVAIRAMDRPATVYNLRTDDPHTFFASGVAVHNKGGGGGFGGGGRGFRSGRGGYRNFNTYGNRTSSTTQPGPGGILGCASPALLFGVFVAGAMIFKRVYARAGGGNSLFSNRGNGSLFAGLRGDEELDELPDTLALGRKASQTRALIQRLAAVDPMMNAERMQAAARETFIELQRCWGARSYGPMRERMMPDLLADHLRQIEAMKRQHEINLIADLGVERVEIVNLRFTAAVNQREFTAMILAHARDYYIDDRTQAFIRGDRQPARFAEYWTFQQWDGRWLLREIEQITESRVLNEANFVDRTAAPGVSEAEGHGAATVITTGGRIAEMMGALAARDPSWARELISARVRRAYTSVYMARQAGDPGQIAGDLIAPDLAQALRQEIESRQRAGETIEHRNFCIRKVEVVAISGAGIRWGKRFVARVVAHGQTFVRRGETISEQDADLRRWTEYASFEKVSDRWLLTALTPGLPASEE